MTTRVDAQLRADCVAIAHIRKERDELGFGLSAVVRKALKDYRRKNRHLLERAGES